MKLVKVVLDAVSKAVSYIAEDSSCLSVFIVLDRYMCTIFDEITGNDPFEGRHVVLPEPVSNTCNRKMVKEVNV